MFLTITTTQSEFGEDPLLALLNRDAARLARVRTWRRRTDRRTSSWRLCRTGWFA